MRATLYSVAKLHSVVSLRFHRLTIPTFFQLPLKLRQSTAQPFCLRGYGATQVRLRDDQRILVGHHANKEMTQGRQGKSDSLARSSMPSGTAVRRPQDRQDPRSSLQG